MLKNNSSELNTKPNTESNAEPNVLVVDLDRTLIKTDMLWETLWQSLANDWLTPFKAFNALLKGGKSQLKQYLGKTCTINPDHLPYNAEVIDFIKSWRADGGKTVLATATIQPIAQNIAEHLQLFDEVHATTNDINLKGANKMHLLVERYGQGGFVYMGDHQADLNIWRQAAQSITVGASKRLIKQTEQLSLSTPTKHIQPQPPIIKPLIRALRLHQWLKNLLIFLPLIVSHKINSSTLIESGLAFLSFGLIASSIYLVNDLLDLESDREHPRKKFRPLASGSLPIVYGSIAIPLLLMMGFVLASQLNETFMAIMFGYLVLTTLYSLYFKRLAIIDVFTLAGLYNLRIFAGAMATGIVLSEWLLAFALFFFFCLAAIKRQAELIDNQRRGKEQVIGRGYAVADLLPVSQVATASGYISVLVMALYLTSDAVVQLYANPDFLWGICVVLFYWINHILLTTHRGQMNDDPIVYAIKDKRSYFCALFVSLFVILAI